LTALTTRTVSIGIDETGAEVFIRVTDDGYVVSKVMALGTETTNDDVQVTCDATGRLNISETIVADVGDIELSVDDVEDKLDTVIAQLNILNSLVPEEYDAIALAYTGSRLDSVTFKTGGISGSTVVTITLGYTGDNLTSVVVT
jgi:hypothetical protein